MEQLNFQHPSLQTPDKTSIPLSFNISIALPLCIGFGSIAPIITFLT